MLPASHYLSAPVAELIESWRRLSPDQRYDRGWAVALCVSAGLPPVRVRGVYGAWSVAVAHTLEDIALLDTGG